jgi:hypothetical protein
MHQLVVYDDDDDNLIDESITTTHKQEHRNSIKVSKKVSIDINSEENCVWG